MELFPLLMFVVLIAALLGGVPVAFSMMGTALLFGYFEFESAVIFQFVSTLDSIASNFVLAAVPLFVFMGAVLERSGIAERLFEAMHIWTRKLPGGLAVSTVLMCVIFAASTGVVGATEVVVGMLAIPVMMKYRYEKSLIAGTICAGGSLGTIIPPSVVVVILGPTADVSVADLFVSIIFPGLLLASLYVAYILIRCSLNPEAGRAEEDDETLSFAQKIRLTFSALIPPAVMIFAVLGSIMFGWAAPTEAAGLGALGSVLLTISYRRFNFSVLKEAVLKTLEVSCMILLILMGGSMFTGVFIASGGGELVQAILSALSLGSWGILIAVLALSFIAGTLLDWISVVLLFIPIFMPVIIAAGFDPIWFCTLFLIIIQTSYITPPMAPAIFYLRGISPPEMTLGDMFRGVVPFIVIQIVALGVVMAFPELALWLPKQVLGFR